LNPQKGRSTAIVLLNKSLIYQATILGVVLISAHQFAEHIIHYQTEKQHQHKQHVWSEQPIAYPIGIVNAPSPIDAHIMKLAVFEFVTAKLNSPGKVINSANINAKNAHTKITPAYAAICFMPPNAHKSSSKDVPIIPANKTFSLLEIFP
jgi:hypothetical protein